MKKITQLPGQSGVFLSLLSLFMLISCTKDDDNGPNPDLVAFVALYHASPDASPVNIVVDNQKINSQPFEYTDYSDYLPFTPGSRTFRLTPSNASNSLADTSISLQENKIYSVFFINRAGNLKILAVRDSLITPAAEKAALRLVHLSPDAPAVDITIDNQSTPLFAGQSYRQASPFVEVTAGTHTFRVKPAGGSDVVLTVPDVALGAGKSYSILVRGLLNPPAGNTSTLAVQLVRNY